ncbi:hypothetical protein KKC91_04135 [bacterium]|nr:hypothetical protein [bacterium]
MDKEIKEVLIQRKINDRQSLQRRETEDFLTAEIEKYPIRQKKYWKRDYSSIEKFLSSVEPNRKRWLETLGDFPEASEDFEVEEEPFLEDEDMIAKWVSIKLFNNLRGRAILGLPKGMKEPSPLIICQHGHGSSPDGDVFGLIDKANFYDKYGYKLIREGFAVLAPLNITMTKPMAKSNRMALLLGKSLFGLEIFKIRRLIDYVSRLEKIDKNRIGMWGLSKGGTYTLFTLPLEKRIKVGIISAFFNHRIKKMVIEDPRYSCFLVTDEEHMFLPGWLREFTDSDLVSLICPRPLMIQTGKADGVSWWPFVLEEFEHSKEHYKKLKIEQRIEICLHNSGHEIRFEEGLKFLRKWL